MILNPEYNTCLRTHANKTLASTVQHSLVTLSLGNLPNRGTIGRAVHGTKPVAALVRKQV